MILLTRIPNLHVTIDEMIAEGDKVICRNRWQGTNAKTGKAMEFHPKYLQGCPRLEPWGGTAIGLRNRCLRTGLCNGSVGSAVPA
jgi:hypothetical protein